MKPQSPLVLVVATALAPLVWGTTYATTTELLPPDRPLQAALLRSLPAGLAAIALTRRLPVGAWWWKAAALGILNIGAFFPFLFIAAEHLPGGVAAILGAAQPLIVSGLSVVVIHERPSRWRLGWAAAGVVGVGFVVLGPAADLDGIGIAAGLASATAMALGIALGKRWGRPTGTDAMSFAGWQLAYGGLVLLPLALLFEGPPLAIDGRAVSGYLWLGIVGGLLAYALWFRGVVQLPATATALLGLLSPLVAATLGAALLGQTLGPVQIAGFGLALLALVAGQRTPKIRSTRNESADPESSPGCRREEERAHPAPAACYGTPAW